MNVYARKRSPGEVVFSCIRKNPGCSAAQLSRITGVPRTRVVHILWGFVGGKRILRTGGRRFYRYWPLGTSVSVLHRSERTAALTQLKKWLPVMATWRLLQLQTQLRRVAAIGALRRRSP